MTGLLIHPLYISSIYNFFYLLPINVCLLIHYPTIYVQQNEAEWEAELEGELEYEMVQGEADMDNPEWEEQIQVGNHQRTDWSFIVKIYRR